MDEQTALTHIDQQVLGPPPTTDDAVPFRALDIGRDRPTQSGVSNHHFLNHVASEVGLDAFQRCFNFRKFRQALGFSGPKKTRLTGGSLESQVEAPPIT